MSQFCYVLSLLSLSLSCTVCMCVCAYVLGCDVLFAVGWDQKNVRNIGYTEFMLQSRRCTTLELIMEKIQIKLLPLFKIQWERKTSIKNNGAGGDKFHNKVLLKNISASQVLFFFRLLVTHQLNSMKWLFFLKCYLSYFCLCYLYLLRLGLGSCESRVASFNENNEHRVGGKIHTSDCMVSVTDWCYTSLYILHFSVWKQAINI